MGNALDGLLNVVMPGRNKKTQEDVPSNKGDIRVKATREKSEQLFKPRNILEMIAPDGVNPNPLNYVVVNDGGQDIYCRSFFVEKLPRRATFAYTFEGLLNFPNATSSVFINPLGEGKATKELDDEITGLESELLIANERGDRNRARKIGAKMHEAEEWSKLIDAGENSLFLVGFLITLHAYDLEELDLKSGDLKKAGRTNGIEICSCFGFQAEALQMNGPTNSYVPDLINMHKMDKYSLSTIFDHTRSEFAHAKGILLGRHLFTGKPTTWDAYDASHNGYGVVITGQTNAGKSTTVKILCSRKSHFGYRFASLDTDARGNRGEYSLLAEKLNGVNYQISAQSDVILNLFEVEIEREYDEITQQEYDILALSEKIIDITHILMTMIRSKESQFETATFIERIIKDCIRELYDERGIYEGDTNSLFTHGSDLVGGRLVTGLIKKPLPVLSDFYHKVMVMAAANDNGNYVLAYDIILAALSDYVREMSYCPACLARVTDKQIQGAGDHRCPRCQQANVVTIRGTKPYYDGQSTIRIDSTIRFTNIDVSQLPESEKPVAQEIALNYINENFIKKNSKNPRKAEKLVVLFDETHKMFPFPEARKFIVNVYRTARKRNVSPWTATQALVDYQLYPECMAIIKNSAAKFILRHDMADRKALVELTSLTDSQAELVMTLDKGEVALVDMNRVVFVKIDRLDIEMMYTETDMTKIQSLYERGA